MVEGPPCKDFSMPRVARACVGSAPDAATVRRKINGVQGVVRWRMVTRDDVVAAAARIAGAGRAHAAASKRGSQATRLWLKCECLQTGGAFKLRGATNRLLQLSEEERARGVVAFSSGNHAQGVAIAARRLGIKAMIVMPADAPALKIEGTRAEGAEIIFYDRRSESREAIAARDRGGAAGRRSCRASTIPYIVAGQGTVGLEILDQLGGEPPQRSSCRAAAAGWRRESRWPARVARSSRSSPKAGTTWRARCAAGEIVPVERRCAADPVRRAADPARVADHLRHLARAAGDRSSRSATPRSSAAVRWAWRRA